MGSDGTVDGEYAKGVGRSSERKRDVTDLPMGGRETSQEGAAHGWLDLGEWGGVATAEVWWTVDLEIDERYAGDGEGRWCSTRIEGRRAELRGEARRGGASSR